MSRFWFPLTGCILVLLAPPLLADDFQGAAKLIERIKGAAPTPDAPAPASTKDTYAALAKDFQAYKQATTLSPNDAARQWLELFKRSVALRSMPRVPSADNVTSRDIVQALPGPASWAELQRLVEAQNPPGNELGLALLPLIVHTLNNEEDKQWADLDTIGRALSSTSTNSFFSAFYVLEIGSKLSEVSGNPAALEKFWKATLAGLYETAAQQKDFDAGQFELPDFVALVGEARAEPLILAALQSPAKILRVQGRETQALGRKLALAHFDELKQPPWCLTESLDATELYDALAKKFNVDENSTRPAIYHVLGLVVHGKADEAVQASALLSGYEVSNAAEQAAEKGYGEQVYQFFHTLLKLHPDNDSWETYVQLAAQTGHAPEALQFVQDSLARKDLTDAALAQIGEVVYKALLAVDKVDEGIAELKTLIQNAKAEAAKPVAPTIQPKPGSGYSIAGKTGTARNNYDPDDSKLARWDIDLARLGHLLKRDDLEKEGLADARQRKDKDDLITYLMRTGRNGEAEKLLIDAIVDEKKTQDNSKTQWYEMINDYRTLRQKLIKLTEVYYNAGRWNDVLTVLQQAPGWNAGDLVEIVGERENAYRYSTPSVGLMAARALAETGQADKAQAILDYTLQIDSGDDAAYSLLLKIGQGDLVAKLDALYKQDQFENRPLIWKATVLLQEGKISQAEAACKAAIAVDPSDGQTGKGDRMRVYSVMADVYEAEKDQKQADFFRNVVKAIRLSEDADDFFDAGLITHAVGMYAKALDLFSDAYCIQSRIARQLAQLGRTEEAAVHYRKAFELMPVSFGRLESHCFGCERAFQGKTAVGIAEQTFNDMLAKDPKKPQISYLLGYLDMEQERYPEAITHFKRAAELDPDYINAWKQIMEIGNSSQLPPDLRDEAVFNIIRLDPAGRHIRPDIQNVRQLAKLWDVETKAAAAVPAPPASLLPLNGSLSDRDDRMERAKKLMPPGYDTESFARVAKQLESSWDRRRDRMSPQEILTQNGILTITSQIMR